jgi:PAS domain S-box-containing protein/putative nucleotidyltransferase with HDIG domain
MDAPYETGQEMSETVHKRVLVADDEPSILELLDAILRGDGYQVLQAPDGKKAVKLAREQSIDVALLDLRMPVMDGLHALKEIKRIDPTVEVLVMTGQPDMATLKQILDQGAFDYVVKPFTKAEIENSIRNAIQKRDFAAQNALMKQELRERIEQVERKFEERTRDLREQQIKYKQIVENSSDAIVVAQDGKLKFANPRALELIGGSAEEIANVPFLQLIHPEDRDGVGGEHPKDPGAEDSSAVPCFRVLNKDQNSSWVELSSVETSWEGSRATLHFMHDITERWLAQHAIEQSMGNLRKALMGTIQAMAMMVEARDPYTAGHQRRVARIAHLIALEMGLGESRSECVRMAGAVHDIGKIALPADILSKPGKLTETEFDLIKDHSQSGYDILREIEFPWPLADIVLQHHERMNGSGYPSGLPGDEISLEARILAVADVVEAMGSHRPYRPALGFGKALDEVSHKKGILYDKDAVEACLRVFTEKAFQMERDGLPASTRFYLVIQQGLRESEFFPLNDRITVGREKANHIILADERVSRLHAVIDPVEEHAFIEDMGSRNGTWLNGKRIHERTRLAHGDTIKIGGVFIRFFQ